MFARIPWVASVQMWTAIRTEVINRIKVQAWRPKVLNAERALVVWWRNVAGIRFVGRLRPMLGALSGLPSLLDRGGRDADDPPQGSHHPGCPRRDCAIAGANRSPGAAL